MMARPPRPQGQGWYFRLMADRRRAYVRHWPWVLVALAAAITIGLLSPDRTQPGPASEGAPAAAGR